MGLLTENEVVLIKNLYVIVGLWLASRFMLYVVFDDRGRPSGTTPGYVFAFLGTIICGYSAIVTAGYGSWESLGTPNFYADWALTVPLILLSMWVYETMNDTVKDERIQQFGFQVGFAAVAIAGVCLFLLSEPADTGNNELWVLFGTSFFLFFTLPFPRDRWDFWTGSNRWLAGLLAAYPLLYFTSVGGFGDGVSDNSNSLVSGFTKDSFDNSILQSIGLNWYDLIGLLFLLSFVCKFWFSYWHVRSVDPDFNANLTPSDWGLRWVAILGTPVDNPPSSLQSGLLLGSTLFVVFASIAAFLSYLTL